MGCNADTGKAAAWCTPPSKGQWSCDGGPWGFDSEFGKGKWKGCEKGAWNGCSACFSWDGYSGDGTWGKGHGVHSSDTSVGAPSGAWGQPHWQSHAGLGSPIAADGTDPRWSGYDPWWGDGLYPRLGSRGSK